MSEVRAPIGIVLAGGRSSRFGRDKLAELIGNEPLLWRPIRALAEAGCAEIMVVAAPTGDAHVLPDIVGVRVSLVRDEEAFGGPLSGLRTGLSAMTATATDQTALVVGGDQPSLVPAVLRDLAARSEVGRRPVTLADESGRMRPLPIALAARPALAAATRLLGQGERRLRVLATVMAADPVPYETWRRLDPGAATLVDIDRQTDLPDSDPSDPAHHPP
jgi:molybdenum cofactor guanylyltransferase